MSAHSIQMDSEASSQSSDSGPEGSDLSQVSRKPKQRSNRYRAWNFQYTLQTDHLGEEGVTTHEKMNLLIPIIGYVQSRSCSVYAMTEAAVFTP